MQLGVDERLGVESKLFVAVLLHLLSRRWQCWSRVVENRPSLWILIWDISKRFKHECQLWRGKLGYMAQLQFQDGSVFKNSGTCRRTAKRHRIISVPELCLSEITVRVSCRSTPGGVQPLPVTPGTSRYESNPSTPSAVESPMRWTTLTSFTGSATPSGMGGM